ncbi:hypothetical protein BAU15_05015 [Enterococcus sp. JM4C]|uniref:DUF4809 family protein n=1 Tax=Candidatus Enterococcus huntleyi TaxID=1857217 RepID=UPI00137AC27C|nr:DUF4809 family protein [Enterococcus sp. JM4C]KAF1295118.1 hypothetical protein BAU15_05015 [Enterococcus sp. JM4C]
MKATIMSEDFLTEGGCNACAPVRSVTYLVEFSEGRPETIEELDVESLVVMFALKTGWKQAMIMTDDFEDAIQFKKDQAKVVQTEDYKSLTYASNGTVIKAAKKIDTLDQLAEKTNEILQTFFGVEPVEFEFNV